MEAYSTSIQDLCQELDRRGVIEQVEPEDPRLATEVWEPINSVLRNIDELPDLPPGPAASVARGVWARLHPGSDLWPLLPCLGDPRPVVRLTAVAGLHTSLLAENQQWRVPPFPAKALQAIQSCRDKETSRTISLALKDTADAVMKLNRPARKARAQVKANPYVAGMPVREPDKFFGRQDILTRIGNTLGMRPGLKSFVIYGARRSGKTSILLRIKNGSLGKDFLPVYIDMQGFAGVTANVFLSSLARTAVTAAAELVDGFQAPTLPSSEDPSLRLAVQDTLKSIAAATSLNLLFLIDEYEILLDYIKNDPSLAMQLQHLVEDRPNLFFVFAGSHQLETVAGKSSVPLLDAAIYLKVTFLNREDALDLVTKPAAGILKFDEGVPERLVSVTAGHPFYLQLLGQTLFESAIARGGVVTQEMFEEAIKGFIANPSPHVVLTWNELTLQERASGAALASLGAPASPGDIQVKLIGERYPAVPSTANIRKSLSQLCELGWVGEDTAQVQFRYVMELVRLWVAGNRSLRALADEQRAVLEERLAPPWRQAAAAIVDTLLAGAGWAVALGARILFPDIPALPVLIYVLAALFVFLIPMSVGKFTVGLRLMNLYPVSRDLTPLTPAHTLGYAALMACRAIAMLSIILIIVYAVNPDGNLHPWLLAALGVIVIVDDFFQFTAVRHRGMWERIGYVQLMYRR